MRHFPWFGDLRLPRDRAGQHRDQRGGQLWTRRAPSLLLLTAVVSACGRSSLDEPRISDLPDIIEAPAPGVSSGAPPLPPQATEPVPLIQGHCPAALMSEAPAPVAHYCPTHAGTSDFSAPIQPKLAWSSALPGTTLNDEPLLITSTNRVFLRTEPENDPDSAWIPRRLVAIEQGKVVFVHEPGEPIGAPILAIDGAIRYLSGKPTERKLIKLSIDGVPLGETPLPDFTMGEPVVGTDGTLHFRVDNFQTLSRIAAINLDGSLRWLTDELGEIGWQPSLGRDGRVLLATTHGTTTDFGGKQSITALDPDGTLAWETLLDDQAWVVSGPVVGPDGAIHAALWTDKSTRTTLVTLEPSGTLRRRIDVNEPPWGGGVPGLWTGNDGTTYIKAGEALIAIDAQGNERFRRYAHPNVTISITVDKQGLLLLSASTIEALDPLTGQALWATDPPPNNDPKVIYFAGGATLGNGAFFLTNSRELFSYGP